ncbi:DUF7151 family protein [Flavobacterium suzhouense]|uniref:DUF7151 domain-containing protein n=1 Tax=Flavobacterium suzhouense TaxID=1529638 RepID=A0ABW5NR04_9FLAO
MKTNLRIYALCIAYSVLSSFAVSCDGEDGINGTNGNNGINSLVSTQIESAGLNCETGGLKVNYGLDNNNNGILDDAEIQHFDYVCNGENATVDLDNLVRLPLGSPDMNVCSTTAWYISPHQSWHLQNFNKHDYANVKSILFVPSLSTPTPENIVTAELYNITDNIPIANTQLTHNSANYVFKYSENIYDALPDHTITLGIRLKNSKSGGATCGTTGTYSYLYILRE